MAALDQGNFWKKLLKMLLHRSALFQYFLQNNLRSNFINHCYTVVSEAAKCYSVLNESGPKEQNLDLSIIFLYSISIHVSSLTAFPCIDPSKARRRNMQARDSVQWQEGWRTNYFTFLKQLLLKWGPKVSTWKANSGKNDSYFELKDTFMLLGESVQLAAMLHSVLWSTYQIPFGQVTVEFQNNLILRGPNG